MFECPKLPGLRPYSLDRTQACWVEEDLFPKAITNHMHLQGKVSFPHEFSAIPISRFHTAGTLMSTAITLAPSASRMGSGPIAAPAPRRTK